MKVRELYEQEAARAYAFARQLTGAPAEAEDAVAEAFCLLAAGRAQASGRAELLALVRRCAIGAWRSERARRTREEGYAVERGSQQSAAAPVEAAERADLVRSARGAMGMLSPAERAIVSLCCEQGLGPQEAAQVMNLPLETVRSHRRRGLERLRELLSTGGGFAAASLVAERLAEALAAAPVEPLPAALAAKLSGIVAQSSAAPATAAAATAKGGFLMKIGLGFAAAVALAGAVALVNSVGAQHALRQAQGPEQGRGAAPLQAPPAAPAEKKAQFDIPVWSPDARWVREAEPYGGSGLRGQLDGPLREGMWGRAPGLRALTPLPENGPYAFKSFDAETSRIHMTVGGASGLLDGPLARARFGTWGYMNGPHFASSPNGRYHFFLDVSNKFVIRRIDLVERVVTTFMQANWKTRILLPDDDGGLRYLLDGALTCVDAQGKAGRKIALELKPDVPIGSVTMDPTHDRLYASCEYDGTKGGWYVWYWDLKDGSFHGVLPAWQTGQPKHGPGGMAGPNPGPFKGTSFYPQMACFWGPDDPEKNFLYILPNDCSNFYRLDLKKEEVWCASVVGNEIAIIGTGETKRIGMDFHGWLPDGSFVSSDRPWDGARIWRCRRTK